MNVAFFLTPISRVASLSIDGSVADAIDQLRTYRYTAVPLLDREGRYVGTLTEGDVLLYLADGRPPGGLLREVERRVVNKPIGIDTDMRSLLSAAADQNFVPVVDSRGVLMGIVTRKAILAYCERLLQEHGLLPG